MSPMPAPASPDQRAAADRAVSRMARAVSCAERQQRTRRAGACPGTSGGLSCLTTGATVIASDADPLAGLIGAQRLAAALADRKGIDPDQPRALSRSVILL